MSRVLPIPQPSAVNKGPGKDRMTNCQTGTVQQLGTELLFIVVAGEEDLAVAVEPFYQVSNRLRCTHSHYSNRIDAHHHKSSRSQKSEADCPNAGWRA
jgi:hypothetical protein